MYLKRIDIQGFKSFADKTKIKMESGVTVIVGPNGSGKSNISDAVRWVLGEQSVKSLRGNKMQDIIFSGTNDRKATGLTEVSLVLDNSQNTFPIDYMEVVLTRRMYRSGESEYYINKNNCRLKDIRELLMDTGVGKDGYSIIGQGRVEEILSSKSEERRNIFEEVAGIVKYKTRREESEKKLKKTKENMLRVNDIVLELENQINPLKSQSEKAKKWKDISEKAKKLDIELFKLNVDEINDSKKEYSEKLLKIEIDRNQNEKGKKKLDNIITEKEKTLELVDLEIKEINEKKYEKLGNIEKKESNEKILENKIQNFTENIEKVRKEKIEIEIEIENFKKELEENRNWIIEHRKILSKKNIKNRDIQKEHENVLTELTELEKHIEKLKTELIEKLNESSNLKIELNTFLSYEKNIKQRYFQIDEEIETDSKKQMEIRDISAREGDRSKELEIKKLKIEKEVMELNEKEIELSKDLEILKKILEEIRSEGKAAEFNLKLLKELKNDYEGYNRGVKEFFNYCKKNNILRDDIDGTLGELIDVEENYEKAIEISLGAGIQNIVVRNQESAKESISVLKEKKLGRVTFLPVSSIKSRTLSKDERKILLEKNVIGIASDIVKYDSKYKNIIENILGRIVIVKSIDDMIRISKDRFINIKIVTLDGDMLNPGGSMTGGEYKGNRSNLLGRNRQIEELAVKRESLREKWLNENKKLEAIDVTLKNNRNKLEDKELEKSEIAIEKNEVKNKRDYNNEKEIEISERLLILNTEKKQLKIESDNILLDKKRKENILEGKDSEIEEIKKNIGLEEAKIYGMKKKIDITSSNITEIKVEETSLDSNIKNKEENNLKIESNIEKNIGKVEGIEKNIQDMKSSIGEFNEEIESIKKDIIKLDKDTKSISEKLSKAYIIKNNEEGIIKENKNKLSKLNIKSDQEDDDYRELIIKVEKLDLKFENLTEKMLEEYEIEYIDLIDIDVDHILKPKLIEELSKYKKTMKDLGNINIDAIEEYESVRERYEFLTKQRDDLLSGESSLKQVIDELNEKMKEEFSKKFTEIRRQFKETFVKLFGGGRADIFLSDESDILNSGIEIVAQPPGKNLKTLSLLSGGEKALTAISVLFAILKIKPTPFCILDEIESALDEANVYRYGEFLKNFSLETQFIVVSHRKGTMESADTLYGVTMEEQGISKIISVKLTDKFIEKLK